MGVKRGRIFLLELDPKSAEDHGRQLQQWGWTVSVETADGALACKHVIDDPPDVVVISLDRFPSQGREAGRAIRLAVPQTTIVFVNGTSEAVSKAMGVVPGATHAAFDDLEEMLRKSGRLRIVD